MTVWNNGKGKDIVEVVRGHRRLAALTELNETNPTRFAELFPKGIPAFLLTEVTPEEVINLKLDHTGVETLSDPHEVQRSANMLFDLGDTEADVSVKLCGLIDRISPMKAESKLELAAKQEALKKAEASGNKAEAEVIKRDIKLFIFTYRRGYVQGLHNTWRCPHIVMASLYKKSCGETPKGFEGQYLPPLISTQVTALWNAHKEDLTEMDGGLQKFNKTIVGPKFQAKWDEICTKAKAAEANPADKKAKPKAMPASEMDVSIKEGKLTSELAVKLTRLHMGEKGIADITELDKYAYEADQVRRNDPKAWADFRKVAAAIEAKRVEANKAANANAKKS
jgi:hypothetical protein